MKYLLLKSAAGMPDSQNDQEVHKLEKINKFCKNCMYKLKISSSHYTRVEITVLSLLFDLLWTSNI